METAVTRSVAGAGVALSLALGGWVGARMTLDTADAIDVALARKIDPEQAQREALKEEASYHSSEAFYQTTIDESVAAHEVPAPSLQRLREPNTFYQPVTPGAPKVISPGASLREAGLEIRVKTEEIAVERRGVRTKNLHTLAILQNVGKQPLAYFVDMRAREGDCQMRAVTRYDAMVLLPKEQAELSICSGEHAVEVIDLRLMEVTELGALWVSKVPPQAVGHDELGRRSHFPGPGIELCAEVPAVEFARQLDAGNARWEDIVDFYSRHDCDQYRWWPGYRRIVEPLDELPAMPPA